MIDMTLEDSMDKIDLETLRMSVIHYDQSKNELLGYLEIKNDEEHEPELILEAVKMFLKLIQRGEVEEKLTLEKVDKILTSLVYVLKNNPDDDWRMQLKVREMLIELGEREPFKKRFVWRELKDIVSDKNIANRVKVNAARVLASLKEDNDNVKKVLTDEMQKGGREFPGNTAAIALLKIGDKAGLTHISESMEYIEGDKGFWAAYLLGQLLSNNKQDSLIEIENKIVSKVIEQLQIGSENTKFNKYVREHAKRIVVSVKANWVEDPQRQ